ncbi:MAG: hypothetical protein EZS28_025475 [Streblomastix strix]|uniref:Uncharacterized protein n=1 Tax=Streblomastix strix TaxID=222440 RepID=A0A5J4V908_9EUKA|nr:MAG: hypothetical protein EZS28_025475 [Streblomastix strix]
MSPQTCMAGSGITYLTMRIKRFLIRPKMLQKERQSYMARIQIVVGTMTIDQIIGKGMPYWVAVVPRIFIKTLKQAILEVR